jgi:hypothetical protein
LRGHEPITLIAEGIAGGKITLPSRTSEEETVWRVVADPVADMSWVGDCNATIRSQIEPLLQAAIQRHGLAETPVS